MNRRLTGKLPDRSFDEFAKLSMTLNFVGIVASSGSDSGSVSAFSMHSLSLTKKTIDEFALDFSKNDGLPS